MKNSKFLAVFAVAVFCASLTAVAINVNVDSSADFDPTVEYDFYLQLNDGEHSYIKWLPTTTVVGAAPSKELFTQALAKACEAEGLTATVTSGSVKSIEAKGTTYAKSGTWEQDPYYNYAQYYLKADNSWGYVQSADYNTYTVFGIVFDKYLFSEPSNKDKYWEDPAGYYTLLPAVEPVEYKIYLQLNDGEHTFAKWLPTVKALNTSKAEMSKAVKAACKEAGVETDYADGWATEFKANDITYKTKGDWYAKTDYWSFAQYYKKSDSEWGTISTYNESNVVSIVYDEYKFTEPTENKDSYYNNYDSYWTKLPSVAPSDADKKDNNLVLYIVIGVVAVVAVAAIAFFVLKKKA